jgi:Fe-S cluster biogenesis protein NfuA
MKAEGKTVEPLKLDAPFFTDEELDALYERDPVAALRISREQHRLRRELEAARAHDPQAPPPTEEGVRAVLEEARHILMRDGGDLEFVALAGTVVRVRMKGNCAGCPRSVLDLKHVVEQLVRNRFPQITEVRNVF